MLAAWYDSTPMMAAAAPVMFLLVIRGRAPRSGERKRWTRQRREWVRICLCQGTRQTIVNQVGEEARQIVSAVGTEGIRLTMWSHPRPNNETSFFKQGGSMC